MLAPDTLAWLLDATPLVLLLDIDGTLCDLVSNPAGARVPDATRRVLQQLTHTPGVRIALLTGRAVRDARRIVDVPGIPIVGNHGLEWVGADGEAHPIDGWEEIEPEMRRAHDSLLPVVSRVPGAQLEDKTYSLTVHYRNVEPALVSALGEDVSRIAMRGGLRIAEGKCVLNVLPPIDVDKGVAALRLVRESGAVARSASVLFAGDDVTDEDAFRALAREVPDAVTVRVGEREDDTAARFRIPSPAALARALELLAERRAA